MTEIIAEIEIAFYFICAGGFFTAILVYCVYRGVQSAKSSAALSAPDRHADGDGAGGGVSFENLADEVYGTDYEKAAEATRGADESAFEKGAAAATAAYGAGGAEERNAVFNRAAKPRAFGADFVFGGAASGGGEAESGKESGAYKNESGGGRGAGKDAVKDGHVHPAAALDTDGADEEIKEAYAGSLGLSGDEGCDIHGDIRYILKSAYGDGGGDDPGDAVRALIIADAILNGKYI